MKRKLIVKNDSLIHWKIIFFNKLSILLKKYGKINEILIGATKVITGEILPVKKLVNETGLEGLLLLANYKINYYKISVNMTYVTFEVGIVDPQPIKGSYFCSIMTLPIKVKYNDPTMKYIINF